MIINCPKCKVPLIVGRAIKPKLEDDDRVLYIVPQNKILSWDELELIDCLKCPQCGFSDDGN